MSETMRAAVESYIEHFNAQDAAAITALFADNASVTDPVGTEPKQGQAAILAFYQMAVANGAKLALDGPIRTAANAAAFSFRVTVGASGIESKAVNVALPPGGMTIDVIDVFTFDDAGKVMDMKAYWGPSNITRT